MAYERIKLKNNFDQILGYMEYQCELIADINTLPTTETSPDKCAAGSVCYCEENKELYILSVDGVTWKII